MSGGKFVWRLDLFGGYYCERWPADMPLNTRNWVEPILSYPISEEEMQVPLDVLAVKYPPPEPPTVHEDRVAECLQYLNDVRGL